MSNTNSLPETLSCSQSSISLEDGSLSPEQSENIDAKGYRLKKQGKWSTEEDELLRKSVTECGEKQWHKICKTIPGRTAIQCLHRWSKILKPGLVKGPWTAEEDFKLMAWVKKHGASQWTKAGEVIQGRSGKQCRERWFNSLNPDVKKGGWTPEEDRLIFELYKSNGSSWSKIAKFLPGRSENSVKNRFYSTLRKTNVVSGPLQKSETEKVFNVSLKPEETVGSTQVEEPPKKEDPLDEERKKKQNELYHLLKRSYSEQKLDSGDSLKADSLKLEMNKLPQESIKFDLALKAENSLKSKENDLNLAKRFNSCKVTGNELEEYEKVQKKMLSLNNPSIYNATNLAPNLLQTGNLAGGLFGQNLNLGVDSLLTNPLLEQLKTQQASLAAQSFNPSLLLGLNPLALNLQANALLGGLQTDKSLEVNPLFANTLSGFNGRQGFGAMAPMPLGTRSVNIDNKETQEKKDFKEDYEGAAQKLNGNGLGGKNDMQRLLEAQAQAQSQGQKDLKDLMTMSSMIYNSQLQSLMNSYGALAARGFGNMDTSMLMRNPLEAALANNKALSQPFPFATFQ